MRILTVLPLMIGVLAGPALAQEAPWAFAGVGNFGAAAVDMGGLTRDGAVAVGRVATVQAEPLQTPQGVVDHVILAYRWDCEGRTDQMTGLQVYGVDGRMLAEQAMDGPARPVVDGTSMGNVWAVACGVRQQDKRWADVAGFIAEYRATAQRQP